jgi:serine/threonine protein kinase
LSSELPRKLGRYTLEKLLARGGMGEIYLALSKGASGIDKPCVIKALPPGLAHDEEFVTRFLDEARIVTTLSHGNIAQIFEVGREGDEFFLAMEYVDGRDLRQVLARCFDRKIKPPIEIGLFVVQELLRGLSYAHRKNDADKPLNLIHRDICPQNVMVSFDGAVKLIDFGLAKSALKSLTTNPTILLGKVAYMSPEQARREKLDRRSDVYSAGVVLFEVLTGKRRYNEKNPQELLQRVRTPGPFQAGPELGLPEPVLKSLNKALEPTLEARYQTADEFRKDLSAALVELYPRMDAERLGEFIRELFVDPTKGNDNVRTVEFEKPAEPKPPAKPAAPVAKPATPVPAVIATPKSHKTPEPAPKAETDNELTEQFPEHMLAELFGSQPDPKHQQQNTNPSYSAPAERRSYDEVPEEDQGGATIPAIQMPTEEDFAARAAARAAKAAAQAQEQAAQQEPPPSPAPVSAEEVAETQQMVSVPEQEPKPAPKAAPAPVKPTPAKLQVASPQASKPATPPQASKVATPPAKPAAKPNTPPSPQATAKPKQEVKPKPEPKAVKPKSPPPQEADDEDDDPPITPGPRTEVISYPKPSSNRKQREQKKKQARLRAVVLVVSLLLLIPSAAILTAFVVNPTKVRTLFGLQTNKVSVPDTKPTSVASTSASLPETQASNPATNTVNPTTNTVAPTPSPTEDAAQKAISSLNNSLRSKSLLREDSPAIAKAFDAIEAAKDGKDISAIDKAKRDGLTAIVSTKIDADFIKKKTERAEASIKKKGLSKNSEITSLQKQLKSEKKVEKKNEVLNKIFKILEAK